MTNGRSGINPLKLRDSFLSQKHCSRAVARNKLVVDAPRSFDFGSTVVRRSRVVAVAVASMFFVISSPVFANGAGDSAAHRIGVTDAAPAGGLLEALMFYGAAGPVVLAAIGVCFSKNVVRMAVWLFVALGGVAMMYFLLAANFLASIQLIVYVGGTLVLLIFGVMLTNKSPWVKFSTPKSELIAALGVCVLLFLSLTTVLTRTVWPEATGVVPGSSMADFGRRLLTTYLVPFEVAGVLLFIVMVGAAHLARPEK